MTNESAILGPDGDPWSHCIAIGTHATAEGRAAVAIGDYTKAKGDPAVAIGHGALAVGDSVVAIGRFSK